MKPNHKPRFNNKPRHMPTTTSNGHQKSLLQKITNNHQSSYNHQSGKLLITKLNDYVEDKCLFGNGCAHLRAQAKCEFLHEKKDYEFLSIPLPEKYLQNEEPAKKSKQQRKEDKIRERAERKKRLEQKLQAQDNRKPKQQKQFQPQQTIPAKITTKVKQQKIMDQKQLLIQKIVKPTQGHHLSLTHIYQHLNMITDAISQNAENIYSQQFPIQQLKLTIYQVRKRLLMKFKKNKEFQTIQKLFVQKQNGFVKKIIKNIAGAYPQLIEQVKQAQNWKNIDLRQIQQSFTVQDIDRVLNSKKENAAIIEYYSRLFSQEYGYPISYELLQEEEKTALNKGNLLPLRKFELLPIICPNFTFSRLFLSLDIQFSQLRALSQFSSLQIPYLVAEKFPVQKTYTIDISSISYNKFVEQIMTEFLGDYHQKLKGPAKQFEFGKIEQNLKKYRQFLAKYKTKITTLNKQNSFVLVVYNIKGLIEKIQSLGLQENLDYDKIKNDRSLEEQNTYEKIFLLRQFISIIGENNKEKLKVIYVTPNKKFKAKNYKTVLQSVDKVLEVEQKEEQEKMEVEQ